MYIADTCKLLISVSLLSGPNAPGGPAGNTGSSAEQPAERRGGVIRKEVDAKVPRAKLHQRKATTGAKGKGKGKAKREPQRPCPALVYSELCAPKPTLAVYEEALYISHRLLVNSRTLKECNSTVPPVTGVAAVPPPMFSQVGSKPPRRSC